MFLASFHITLFINYVRLNCYIKFYLKTNNAFIVIYPEDFAQFRPVTKFDPAPLNYIYGHAAGFELDLTTGGQFVPLADILGGIIIFKGTDKFIFIQHSFTFIQTRQQNEPCNTRKVIQTRKVKLTYWCVDFFSSYLNRVSMTML